MKALSLFSGIGGIDLAAEWAGIETVAFCEREPFCQKVLAKHWPNVPIYDDVCTLTKERLEADGIGTIELIHGGYPCQPFSNAGKREGAEDDRHLWPEVFRLIQAINPRWFVGENVAGHITLGLDIVLSDLDSIDYSWESFVIPACAVDARHRRDRVFIVAYSKSEQDRWVQLKRLVPDIMAGSREEDVADSKILDQRGLSIREKAKNARPAFSSENVADTKSERCGETRELRYNEPAQWTASCGEADGWKQWTTEPDVGRVANGIPSRVDRLKALGNAVVPQQIYPILAAIKQIDDMLKAEGHLSTEYAQP